MQCATRRGEPDRHGISFGFVGIGIGINNVAYRDLLDHEPS
jgi:hypothetical protein